MIAVVAVAGAVAVAVAVAVVAAMVTDEVLCSQLLLFFVRPGSKNRFDRASARALSQRIIREQLVLTRLV